MICEHREEMRVHHINDCHFFCPACGIMEYVVSPNESSPDVVYFIDRDNSLSINPAIEDIPFEFNPLIEDIW